MFHEKLSSSYRRWLFGWRTVVWAGALLFGLAHCRLAGALPLGWRTAAWLAHYCLAGALLLDRCGALLLGPAYCSGDRRAAGPARCCSPHDAASPSPLLLAIPWAHRRARSGHACSIVCGSFATRSDDGVFPHIRSRRGRRRTEAGCRWPSEDDRLPPAVGRRLSASGRRKRRRAADMLGISGGEFLVLLVVGALVLGPKNIAEALRAMRKGIEALRQWSAGMRAEAGGELGVAEKEVAALANLDFRQLDPRRIVREAVREEMEAWMAMADAGGAGTLSSERGADPAGDGTNRAATTAERTAYSAAAFARTDFERANSRRTSSKRAGSKGADAAATKGAQATQGPDAQATQGLDAQGPHKPAAHVPQEPSAQAEPKPNEKSTGELAARDSIEGDKL